MEIDPGKDPERTERMDGQDMVRNCMDPKSFGIGVKNAAKKPSLPRTLLDQNRVFQYLREETKHKKKPKFYIACEPYEATEVNPKSCIMAVAGVKFDAAKL